MTTYAKFTENNAWEGETWHFWIPIEGNEKPLARLATAIADVDVDDEPTYALDLTPVLESDVDVLIKHGNGDTDYMAAHNKLAGRFELSADVLSHLADPEQDPFYKGEIKKYLVVEETMQ